MLAFFPAAIITLPKTQHMTYKYVLDETGTKNKYNSLKIQENFTHAPGVLKEKLNKSTLYMPIHCSSTQYLTLGLPSIQNASA